jgi:hypothetical protein
VRTLLGANIAYVSGEVFEAMFAHCREMVKECSPVVREYYPDGADNILLLHFLSEARATGAAPSPGRARELAANLGFRLANAGSHPAVKVS